jgi:NADH-quinone oxidoreductase subunit M
MIVRWRLFTWILFALVLVATRAAEAQDARRAGTVRLTTASGGPGPIELVPERDGFGAELLIVNDGKEPLVLSRIAVRGDASDPRAPPKLSARIVDASLPVAVPPGGSRKAAVFWGPDKTVRQKQLRAHVVITTSDERAGEVAMGVRAERSGGGRYLLGLLLGIPFVGALASVMLGGARAARLATTIALGAQTLVALWICSRFVPEVTRADGNDGLQFVSHVVCSRALALEIHLGVDGIGATTILATSAVGLFAIAAEPVLPRATQGYYGALLVLEAAAVGALVAMNGIVLVVFVAMTIAAFPLVVGRGNRGRAAAWRATASCAFGLILVIVALVFIARSADPTFLADGTKTAITFDLPDLSRVAFGERVVLVGAKACFVFVAIASFIFLAAFPSHRWLSDVVIEAPPAAGIIVAAAMPAIGLVIFLRIGGGLLPEGMRWASGVIVALGTVSTMYGAFEALGQRDLRTLAAATTTSLSGCVMLGAASLTPQGIGGAIVLGTTRGLACCAFLLLVAAMHDRTKTSSVDRLGGIAARTPGFLTALGAAALAQAGLFGSCGAWGVLLAIFGALSSYAPLAISAAIALVVLGVAYLAPLSHMVFGKLDPEWERSDVLEPHGGRVPDLTRREWSTVVPLIAAVIVLGLWPSPILTLTTGTVRDLANRVSPPGPDQVAFVR